MSKFKVMDWIRRVRDEMYEETKDMSRQERIEYMKEQAKQGAKARKKQKTA